MPSGATATQPRALKPHRLDTLNQFPHVILVSLVPQFVIRLGVSSQSGDQESRIIPNANTVAGQQTQSRDYRRRFPSI
jgi:hypothetical protein